jgi:hypothetical protein
MPATTAAAQAPVPQARVSPAPRSKTRRRTRVHRTICSEAGIDPLPESADACSISGPSFGHRRRIHVGHHLHGVGIAHADAR